MKPEIKKHLGGLVRTGFEKYPREEFLRLDMNENPAGLPQGFVRRVLKQARPEYIAMYPQYRLLQDHLARANKLSAANICLTNGSDAAIKYIFDAYISAGDKVLVTDPTFAMYPVYSRMQNGRIIAIEYERDFSFPFRRFMQAITSQIKLAVVVNPHNPTGSVIPAPQLMAMIKRARAKGVLLAVDEAYFYYYPGSVIRQVKYHPNLLVLRTFSKLCGMAALRLGFAAAHPSIIEALVKVKPTFDVNGIAILFARELLKSPQVLRKMLADFKAAKEYTLKRLRGADIAYRCGHANFILIDCGFAAGQISRQLAERKILVAGGFQQSFLQDYIRVTIGSMPAMQEFCRRFIPFWKKR